MKSVKSEYAVAFFAAVAVFSIGLTFILSSMYLRICKIEHKIVHMNIDQCPASDLK